MNGDRQPDEVEDKVEKDDKGGNPKDCLVSLWVEVVHADGNEEKGFGDDPLNSAKFDIIDIGGKVKAKDGDLGEQEVGGTLAVGGDKGGPGSTTPPGDDETKQSSILAAS